MFGLFLNVLIFFFKKMKALEKSCYNELLLSYVPKIRKKGYDEMADEFLKLLNFSTKNINEKGIIQPINKNMQFKEKTIVTCLKNIRIHNFSNYLISDSDLDILSKELSNGPIQIPDINLAKLHSSFSDEKSIILDFSILQNFRTIDNYFDSDAYIDFVRYFGRTLKALSMFLEIDPFLTTFVSESTIKRFIAIYSKSIISLKRLQDEDFSYYIDYYVSIVYCYFVFYINPVNNNEFNVIDLLSSSIFRQFIDMDIVNPKSNPLILPNTIKLYNLYIELDHEKQSMLRKCDLKVIQLRHSETVKLTDCFLSRLFEMLETFDFEPEEDGNEGNNPNINERFLDLGLFISFLLPLKNMKQPAGTHFFFRMIDLDEDGKLSRFDILYFYKAILKETGIKNHNPDAFLSKLFDIVSCQEAEISEKCLLDSGNQDLFFKLLIDLMTFNDWEGVNEEEEAFEEAKHEKKPSSNVKNENEKDIQSVNANKDDNIEIQLSDDNIEDDEEYHGNFNFLEDDDSSDDDSFDV